MYCRKCGRECFNVSEICDECNEKLLAETAAEEAEEAARAAKKKFIQNFCIGAACVVVAILLIIIAVLVITGQKDGEDSAKEEEESSGFVDGLGTETTPSHADTDASPSSFVVDNFVGMSYAEEVASHPNIGNYKVAPVQTAYNADFPEGHVFKQEPAAGETIEKNGELTLYVSLGARMQEVPLVTPGESAILVKSRLTAAGFTVKEVTESSLEFVRGTVIRLSPSSGAQAPYGEEIVMYVSSGKPEAELIDMPDLLGFSENDAIDRLVAAGFHRNKVTVTAVNDSAPKGAVLSTTPDSGEPCKPDADIRIVVSSGFQDVTISLDLPDTGAPVSLKFYVAGKEDATLSSQYTNILPRDLGKIEFKVGETKETYTVTVKIAGDGNTTFADYAKLEVYGKSGTYTLIESFPFDDGSSNESALEMNEF